MVGAGHGLLPIAGSSSTRAPVPSQVSGVVPTRRPSLVAVRAPSQTARAPPDCTLPLRGEGHGADTTTHAVTILAIDPSTTSLGYAVFRDGELRDAGFEVFTVRRPSAYLRELLAFLDGARDEYGVTAIATERMFVSPFRGGNIAALLNVSVEEIAAWAEEQGIAFGRLANSTIKKEVTGRGDAKKDLVYSYVQHLWEPLKEMPKTHRLDVSDAIAIGVAAMKKGVFPEPPPHV